MKVTNYTIAILLFSIFFYACKKDVPSTSSNTYKGPPLHPQPSISVFPSSSIYVNNSNVSDELSKNLDSVVSSKFSELQWPGISVAMIIPDQGIWKKDTGFISRPDNIPLSETSIFYWASVAKLITSTVIHQLVEENELQLSTPLSNWFPAFEHADKITVQHLLNHTSGIYSFNSDSTFHFSNEFHTPEELLDIALGENNSFLPGEYWSYSNTGYVLLALVAEQIESKTFKEIVHDRICTPQNLSSLTVLEQQETPNNLALAHDTNTIKPTHFSLPLGAGNMVSTASDMALFLQAFLTGEYISQNTAHDMLETLYPMFNNGMYYGNGMMLYEFKEINNSNQQWIGHSGGTEHYKALLLYDINTQIICAISINQAAPVEALALALLNEASQ